MVIDVVYKIIVFIKNNGPIFFVNIQNLNTKNRKANPTIKCMSTKKIAVFRITIISQVRTDIGLFYLPRQ